MPRRRRRPGSSTRVAARDATSASSTGTPTQQPSLRRDLQVVIVRLVEAAQPGAARWYTSIDRSIRARAGARQPEIADHRHRIAPDRAADPPPRRRAPTAAPSSAAELSPASAQTPPRRAIAADGHDHGAPRRRRRRRAQRTSAAPTTASREPDHARARQRCASATHQQHRRGSGEQPSRGRRATSPPARRHGTVARCDACAARVRREIADAERDRHDRPRREVVAVDERPNGGGPSSSGASASTSARAPVASCASAIADSSRPIDGDAARDDAHAAASRKCAARSTKTQRCRAERAASASAVASRSIVSGSAPPATGERAGCAHLGRARARRRRRRAAGSGTSWSSDAATSDQRAKIERAERRASTRATAGTATRAATQSTAGTAERDGIEPPNAKVVQPRSSTSAARARSGARALYAAPCAAAARSSSCTGSRSSASSSTCCGRSRRG